MSLTASYSVSELRRELSARNRAFAREGKLLHVESLGSTPVILYPPYEDEIRHGNFVDQSYVAIREPRDLAAPSR